MKESALKVLRCPISKEELNLEVFETEKRVYNGVEENEIKSGLLTSPIGFLYPIINGVPRLQAESFLEYADFIKAYKKDYQKVRENILTQYRDVVNLAIKRNKKTKDSFGMEWSIYRYNSDSTWGWNKDNRKERFLNEIQVSSDFLKGKRIVDVGCGNGVLTSGISEFGAETFGVDVSPSVEKAYINNTNPNVHYIQGDLQIPPFENNIFDLVYSTGVIHHTNNTELSFSCISELAKASGILYVWLYWPEKDVKHNALNLSRSFTNKLPIRVQYWLYLIFLVPQGLLKMRLKGVKRNWREQLINYFDVLSCEFRYEHTPKEVEVWYLKRNYTKPVVTIEEYLGFGIYGIKKIS
jgi:SAM-dependent methyltransferase